MVITVSEVLVIGVSEVVIWFQKWWWWTGGVSEVVVIGISLEGWREFQK